MKLTDERKLAIANDVMVFPRSSSASDLIAFSNAIAAKQRKLDAEICKKINASDGSAFQCLAAILNEGE